MLYLITIVASLVYFVLMVIQLACYSYSDFYTRFSNTSVGVTYFIDSCALLFATALLIHSLNEYFGGTVLQAETRILKILFGIFTIAYVGQTIFLLLGGASEWRKIQITKSNPTEAFFLRRNYYYFFTLFFDVFPILA